MSSQFFIFGNDCEESVLKIRTYFREENTLLLHNALYAPRCDVPLCLLFTRLVLFYFRLDVLDIAHNGNWFGHVTLKGVFIILDATKHLPSLPHFRFCFSHARLTIRAKIDLSN